MGGRKYLGLGGRKFVVLRRMKVWVSMIFFFCLILLYLLDEDEIFSTIEESFRRGC